MVEFDRTLGVASTTGSSSLELRDLAVRSAIVICRIPIAVIQGSGGVGVSTLPWTPGVIAVDGWGSFDDACRQQWTSTGRGRRSERSSDFNGIWIRRVVGAFDAVAGREEGIKSLDEVGVSAE